MKKNIRQRYIAELKRHLIYIGKREKKYLQIMNDEIANYIDDDTSYIDVVSRFGEPKELASCYLEEYDEATLKKKVNQKRLLVAVSAVFLIAIISIVIIIVMNYINGEKSYITREKEVITEN